MKGGPGAVPLEVWFAHGKVRHGIVSCGVMGSTVCSMYDASIQSSTREERRIKSNRGTKTKHARKIPRFGYTIYSPGVVGPAAW